MKQLGRRSLVTITTGLLAVAAIGAPALAAPPPPLVVTFAATQDNCVDGTGNANFILELQDASTHDVLDTVDPVTPTTGHWHACFFVDVPRFGTRLRAHSDVRSGTPTFTIPNLTVDTDRDTDVVKGDGPAGHQVKVRLYDCDHLDFACHHKATRTVDVNGAGHYSRDMTNAYNAHGFDEARVTYTNSVGNSFMVRQVFPWMGVAPTDAQVFGNSRPGHKVTLQLLSAPGGALLNKRSRTPEFGNFSVTFSTPVSTGRQVTGDFASDAKLTIPSTALSQELLAGHVILHVRCLPDRPVMVDYNPGLDVIHHTDSHGRAAVDATVDDPGWDPATDGVIITCQSAAGDVVTRRFDPPI